MPPPSFMKIAPSCWSSTGDMSHILGALAYHWYRGSLAKVIGAVLYSPKTRAADESDGPSEPGPYTRRCDHAVHTSLNVALRHRLALLFAPLISFVALIACSSLEAFLGTELTTREHATLLQIQNHSTVISRRGLHSREDANVLHRLTRRQTYKAAIALSLRLWAGRKPRQDDSAYPVFQPQPPPPW